MSEMARVCALPLTHGMQIHRLFFFLLTIYTLVFSRYCRSLDCRPGLRAAGRRDGDWCPDHWHLRELILKQPDNPGATQPAARALLNPNTQVYIFRMILISIPNWDEVWADAWNQGRVRSLVPQMHLQLINCHIDWVSPEFHYCPVSTVKEDKCYEAAEKQRRLRSQQDPGWSNEDNWGQGPSRDDVPLKALRSYPLRG